MCPTGDSLECEVISEWSKPAKDAWKEEKSVLIVLGCSSNLVLCSSGKPRGLGYSNIDGDSLSLLRRWENNILIDLLIADQG